MSLDTQIKALLESDEPITEDELVEETIEEIADEDQAEISDEVDEVDEESDETSDEESDGDLNEGTVLSRLTAAHDAAKKHGIQSLARDLHAAIQAHKKGNLKGHLETADTTAVEHIRSALNEEELDDEVDTTKEHIDALLSGEELSEEFRTKATTIFEAAVADGVKKQVAQLEEQYNEMLNDAIISVQEELVDKIDGYLGTIVEEWVTENQLAIERGVKADLVEEFIDGLKKLFNDHYVDIPEEKADILDEQIERLESAESELAEAAQKVAELEEEVVELRKLRNIEMVGEELTDSQFEKFLSLCENVDFESEESFVNKIKTIKESYFPSKTAVNESVSINMDTPLLVDEKTSETINAYVKALSSPLTFKK